MKCKTFWHYVIQLSTGRTWGLRRQGKNLESRKTVRLSERQRNGQIYTSEFNWVCSLWSPWSCHMTHVTVIIGYKLDNLLDLIFTVSNFFFKGSDSEEKMFNLILIQWLSFDLPSSWESFNYFLIDKTILFYWYQYFQ